MLFTRIRHSRKKAFTLVEMLIALSIFSVMSIMTILIYFNVSEHSRRLQISRELTQSAREITERIANDLRSYKIVEADVSKLPVQYLEKTDILTLEKTISPTEKSTVYYFYAKREGDIIGKCNELELNSPTNAHCSIFRAEYIEKIDNNGTVTQEEKVTPYDLVDVFRENHEKRVRVVDFAFYVSDDENKKVTLSGLLALNGRGWAPQSLIQSSKLELQTTFSDRFYK